MTQLERLEASLIAWHEAVALAVQNNETPPQDVDMALILNGAEWADLNAECEASEDLSPFEKQEITILCRYKGMAFGVDNSEAE